MEKIELFFSYSEENETQLPIDSSLSLSDALELFEGATQDMRRKGIAYLYSRLFSCTDNENLPVKLKQTAATIIGQGGLSLLVHHLSFITSQLRQERDLMIEQELRMLLNILYSAILLTPAEEIQSEISQYSFIIEESLMMLIKKSTEFSYIPIKKICMFFNQYLKLILDFPIKKKRCEEGKTAIPRCKVIGTAVESFYARMIIKENPLSQIVVGLLRGLLACCPANSTSGVDIRQEWQSPIALSAQEDLNEMEEPRHRYIAGLYISKVLIKLLKRFRMSHHLQFEYLCQLINDANGVLVILKFLNLETPELSRSLALKNLGELKRVDLIEKSLQTMLKICYKVNKGHPDRIQTNLIPYKSSLIFKKILSKFSNEKIEIPCLKNLRIQIKYLTKKWKSYPSNMKIISEIYQKLPPSKEDWISEGSSEKYNSDLLKQTIFEFNHFNYWQLSEDLPPESPQIPQDFPEIYEEWLEDNVWGYSYMY